MMKYSGKKATLIVWALFPSLAPAVDGVLEINQACATQLGCFGGDTAGYPVLIDGSAGRSYRLTGDLIIPDINTNGIDVTAPNIHIDLNGFEIIGIACVGATTDCTPASGSGRGVMAGNTVVGTSVSNGAVTGMGRSGIAVTGEQSTIKDLRLRWSRLDGLQTGANSIVSNVISFENGNHGITLGANAQARGNTAYRNSVNGIRVGTSSVVIGNVAFNNGSLGISVGGGVVRDNAATSNGGNGINIASSGGAMVANNASTNNGGVGIFVFGNSNVQNNIMANNTGVGLNATSTDAYSGNTMTFNLSPQVNGGVDLGGNFCGALACP